MSRRDVVKFQEQKMTPLRAHAYSKVAYYRELLKMNGLKPDDIHTIHDLSVLPMNSKEDMKQRPLHEILSHGLDPRRTLISITSGSIGLPFKLRHSLMEGSVMDMLRLRARQELGVRVSDTGSQGSGNLL